MKKIYTEIELDNLIRKYGFENKRVIAYAKRLDKQEKCDIIYNRKGKIEL